MLSLSESNSLRDANHKRFDYPGRDGKCNGQISNASRKLLHKNQNLFSGRNYLISKIHLR